MNSLDIAGVTALSRGLKANHVMRCDVNIPPGDEEFARSVFSTRFFFFFWQRIWGNVL